MNWKLLIFIALISYGGYNYLSNRPVAYVGNPANSLAPNQTNIQQNGVSAAEFKHNGYTIKPLQNIELTARVLSTEHYAFDREADLAKVDLALGWGPMSDDAILKQIDISQSNRFYYWHVESFPIPREEIESNSANMHMVAANQQIEKTLKNIKPGQSVKISGYLIEARANDGWHWKSSLSRHDTGAGACELVYVNALVIN